VQTARPRLRPRAIGPLQPRPCRHTQQHFQRGEETRAALLDTDRYALSFCENSWPDIDSIRLS
jgi:hypothetical protein